jgi:dihydroorotase
MSSILIVNARIVNENSISEGDLLIKDQRIAKIASDISKKNVDIVIDAKGRYLLPGIIDDQVHFREPGLTHKADIYTESRAAVAGGITSFMEMPNTVPNTVTQELLYSKYQLGSSRSLANYSFYFGATNDNLDEVLKTDRNEVCGIKVFMGSSTGNMLVDDRAVLEGIFSKVDMLIATHCEDEATIRRNEVLFKARYGDDIPIAKHPEIRSREACFLSSSLAVELAGKYGTKLHVLHISTEDELQLFDGSMALDQKRITAEACIHHLWFEQEDYEKKQALIKWNPAVKRKSDREAILNAVLDNRIDVIATDHARTHYEEKMNTYFKAPSGGPLGAACLVAAMEMVKSGEAPNKKDC